MENKVKEKAEELAILFCSPSDVFKPNIASVKCALICVEEIIKSSPNNFINTDGLSGIVKSPKTALVFWQEVKEHLNAMK